MFPKPSKQLRRVAKITVFGLIILCVLLFSAFSIPYLYVPTNAQQAVPHHVFTSNATVEIITCGFPSSGQYGIIGTTLYFILLPATFILRRVPWLSAAIAASAMTYSGIAAIHLVILFAYNNRLVEDKQRNRCQDFGTGLENETIMICNSTHDPDYIVAGLIVGAGLLAILPITTWSSTFKNANARPILVLWTALLAFGHVFFNLIITNPNLNYQICSSGYSEPLPGFEYQAGPWDFSWEDDLNDILRNNSSRGARCIYSCFATNGYLGRQSSEIGIFPASLTHRYADAGRRGLGVAFWLIYAIMTIAVLVLRWRHPQQRGIWDQIRQNRLHLRTQVFRNICRKCLIECAIQVLSILAYVGFVAWGFDELVHMPSAESFVTVGQWGVVATALMVLLAAAVSRISEEWTADEGSGHYNYEWGREVGYAS